jgi:hypothetical protein
MRILFLFLDGVGLGVDDPGSNPFAVADLPALHSFTGGSRWFRTLSVAHSERGVFIPTDACLGVEGNPQSATGQATIMTGVNVPRAIGGHYGPKPDERVRSVVTQSSMVRTLTQNDVTAGLLNAYPPGFFRGIESGKHLLSANQLALRVADVVMPGPEALFAGRALSSDFTGEGWRTVLGFADAPVLAPREAGRQMARLARDFRFSFFDHWVTDYVGHRGTLDEAVARLQVFDGVVAGLLDEWDDAEGLIVITSDHGNIEDLSKRGHTTNPVPTLIIGQRSHEFAHGLADLTHFAPRILGALLH